MARTKRRLSRHKAGATLSGYDLERAQSEVETVLDDLSEREYLYGVRMEAATLEAGYENLLEHGLGREVSGFFVVDNDAGASVWRVSGSSANTKKYLPLGASSDCVVDVVIY